MTLNLLWLTFTKRYSPRIPLTCTARNIRFTHIYSCANMMRTGCKCVANMVNAVFTTHLHGGCKCMSKYGIYQVCHTFAPRLHHICSWVNVCKSNFSCSDGNSDRNYRWSWFFCPIQSTNNAKDYSQKKSFVPLWKAFRPVNCLVLMAFLLNFTLLSGIYCAILCFLCWMTVFGLARFVRASATPSCALFIRKMISACLRIGGPYRFLP